MTSMNGTHSNRLGTIAATTITLAALFVTAYGYEVTPRKDKHVSDGGTPEATGWDETAASGVTNITGTDGNTYIQIKTTVFTPRSGWSFKEVADGTWVDYTKGVADALLPPDHHPSDTEHLDSASQIQIHTTIAEPASAGTFPIWAEGNLQPPEGGSSDTPTKWHWGAKIQDYEMHFIRQNNNRFAEVGDPACHMVSKFNTAWPVPNDSNPPVNLPSTATFYGPPGDPTDLDTFRVELAQYEGGPDPSIRLLVERAGNSVYNANFGMVSNGSGTWRTNQHIRLVSTDDDDGVRGQQTPKVKLGDIVKAFLRVNGQDAGEIELMVGRPPSENGPRAIRTVTCHPLLVDHYDVKQTVDLDQTISDLSELWAQCSVRYTATDSTVKAQVKNILRVDGDATGLGNIALTVDGAQVAPFAVGIPGSTSAKAIADDIAAGINAVIGAGTAVTFNSRPKNEIAHVVVKKGTSVNLVITEESVPGSDITVPNFDITDQMIYDTEDEAISIAANYADGDSNTLDIIFAKNIGGSGKAIHRTLVGGGSDWANMIYISPDAATRTTYAHEAGHVLLNVGVEAHNNVSATNIMYGGNGIRLTIPQHLTVREQSDGNLLRKE